MTTTYDQDPARTPSAISIIDVLRGIAGRKLMIMGVGLAALAAGLGVVTVLKPVYSSQAQVLIQNQETPFDRVQTPENQRPDAVDDRVVASQISILKSQDLGRRVVAALGLENKPEFNVLLDGQGIASKLKIKLGFGSDPALKTPEQRAFDKYQEVLNVFQLPESNVIGIEVNSSNPELAASVANTLADTFVMWTREAQSQPTERARDWLSQQIDSLRKKVAASEEAVEKFRSEAGLLKGATVTLGEQEISELNSQITVAKAASLEARAKADSIRSILESRGSVDSATDVLNSAVVQRLKEQRTEAMRRISELSAVYLSNHPKMVAARSEIANIDKQIRAEALKVVASLDEQARIAESREKSLIKSLDALKYQEGTANLDDVKLKALEREASADRALLEAMLGRFAEASSRQDLSAQPGFAVVIQSAAVPTAPSFPKPGPMVLLITIAGLSVGLGLAFLLELMAAANRLTAWQAQPTRRDEPQVVPYRMEHVAPAPVMPPPAAVVQPVPQPPVAVPPPPAPPPVVATPEPVAEAVAWTPPPVLTAMQHLAVWPHIAPQSDIAAMLDAPEVAAAVRSIAKWTADIRRELDVKRVGLASLGGGLADSGVAALALARNMAISGKRVVLIDLVNVNAVIGGLSGLGMGPGISDLVGGSADFTKVIGRDSHSPVHVLRYGMDHTPRARGLIIERLESVLAALSQAYDAVIVNLGEATEDTPIYLHKCQGALLMAPAARLMEVTAAAQTLLDTGLLAAQHVLIGSPLASAAALKPEAVSA